MSDLENVYEEKSKSNRPSSIYDNCGNGQSEEFNNLTCEKQEMTNFFHEIEDTDKDKSPTQEFLLKTTVPQNLAATNLAGRHTPTRNSLRHSRMIVLNRQGGKSLSSQSYSNVRRYHRFAVVLVCLHILLGLTISCLSGWFLVWTPNLRKRDNPYWSGLLLLASGTIGLVFLSCYQRVLSRNGFIRYLIRGVKILCIVLCLTAAVASLIASIFATIHIVTLTSMTCETKLQLNDTCFCQILTNSTTLFLKTYHYSDLKCDDVQNSFLNLMIVSAVINMLAGILCFSYIYLLFSTKPGYLYSKVKTKSSVNTNGSGNAN